jgi:hypothetical protein
MSLGALTVIGSLLVFLLRIVVHLRSMSLGALTVIGSLLVGPLSMASGV